eukprot:evm.model.scf_4541.1 EVM.evm.TU.scf_4541.1   scf_4541:2563-5536(-)
MGQLMRRQLKEHQRVDQSFEGIYVPRFYTDLCSAEVLVMEHVNGVFVSDVREMRKVDRLPMARVMVKFFGAIILLDGRFPTDPHGGSILVRCVNGRCQLALVDFAQVRQIGKDAQRAFARIVLALAGGKRDELKSELQSAGVALQSCGHPCHALAGASLFDTGMGAACSLGRRQGGRENARQS